MYFNASMQIRQILLKSQKYMEFRSMTTATAYTPDIINKPIYSSKKQPRDKHCTM